MPNPPDKPPIVDDKKDEREPVAEDARDQAANTLKKEIRIIDNEATLFLLRDYANICRAQFMLIETFELNAFTKEELWEHFDTSPAITFQEYINDRNRRYPEHHELRITEEEVYGLKIQEVIDKVDMLAREINEKISARDLEALKIKIQEMSTFILSLPIADLPEWME